MQNMFRSDMILPRSGSTKIGIYFSRHTEYQINGWHNKTDLFTFKEHGEIN